MTDAERISRLEKAEEAIVSAFATLSDDSLWGSIDERTANPKPFLRVMDGMSLLERSLQKIRKAIVLFKGA